MFKLYDWIIYTGIAAFICLAVTAVLGVTGINYEIHAHLGAATFVLACVHTGLVFYKRYKVRKAKKQAMK
ncbi:MAG: hypothetical protein PHX64_06515 [Candidatus Omnitrophica bacterium]|nr:hypothetical protein [Candidatus Omnitrophota bacterium]MDD5311387.1 hypothetical protein [Candidatus Omnitrophota bacterium]MDD5546095.1 hypothetical protein [Candidatus Omnitrophota bacterium]